MTNPFLIRAYQPKEYGELLADKANLTFVYRGGETRPVQATYLMARYIGRILKANGWRVTPSTSEGMYSAKCLDA